MSGSRGRASPLELVALSCGLILVFVLVNESYGINLADEGFLWYGVQRTAAGEVPLRDFHAYDPGRYYWSAFWFQLLGDGLLQLRVSNAIFAGIGVLAALLAARSSLRSRWALIGLGAVLVIWLFPRHKMFEHGLAMTAVAVACCLISRPTRRTFFGAGLFVGLAAVFGRNHGLYLVTAFGLITSALYAKGERRDLARRLLAFAAGVVGGYGPVLLMLASVPGYGEAFGESLAALLAGERAQLSLPVPWPWALEQLPGDLVFGAQRLATSLAFLVLPATYALAAVAIARADAERIRVHPLLLASTCVGVVYLYHAFSRADFSHLAQVAHPWILCVVGLGCSTARKRVLPAGLAASGLLVAFTFFGSAPAQPSWIYRSLARSRPAAVTTLEIDGHPFAIQTQQAKWLEASREIFERYAGNDRSMLIAPIYPFLYAYLGCAAPSWEVYYLWPATVQQQAERIGELEENRVTAVMIAPGEATDGRRDLRFVNTHPLVWKYIRENYKLRQSPGLPRYVRLYTRAASSFDSP
jgi:hypothetical protein